MTAEELARRAGLEFADLSLLRRALTHRSYINEHPEALEDNERLEFLGDATLDFLTGAWLYNRFPEMVWTDINGKGIHQKCHFPPEIPSPPSRRRWIRRSPVS